MLGEQMGITNTEFLLEHNNSRIVYNRPSQSGPLDLWDPYPTANCNEVLRALRFP